MHIALTRQLALAVVILTLAAAPTLAQNEVLMSNDPSDCEMIIALGGKSDACGLENINPAAGGMAIEGATQGLTLAAPGSGQGGESQSEGSGGTGESESTTAAVAAETEGTEPQRHAAAFPSIQFEFNSSELTASARRTLDRLAGLLQGQSLSNSGFIIEGHTDAVGSAAYNQLLSELRAHAVVDYLVQHGGITPDRLIARGVGESEPYDPRNPSAAVNRRVVVVNVGG